MPKFTLSYAEANGRKQTLVVEAESFDVAMRALAAKPAGSVRDVHETVNDVLDFYFKHKAVTKRQQQRKAHAYQILRLKKLVGATDPLSWDQNKVDEFVEERVAAGWQPSSAERFLKTLHAAFAFSVRRKRLPSTQSLDWSFHTEEVRREGILSRPELAKIFRAEKRRRRQKNPRVRWQELFLWLLVYTAQRPSAVRELTWGQVDWNLRTINFAHGPSTGMKRRPVLPIAQALMPILRRAYRERDLESPYVLGREDRTVKHVLKSAAAIARVDLKEGAHKITNYSMRHTTASLLLREGVAPFAVAGLLGISVQRLLKTYAKHVPSHLQESIDRF